jgi:hypothetical protein
VDSIAADGVDTRDCVDEFAVRVQIRVQVDDRDGIRVSLCDRSKQFVPMIDAMPFEQTLVAVDAVGEIRRLEVRRREYDDACTGGLEDAQRAVELAGQEPVELRVPQRNTSPSTRRSNISQAPQNATAMSPVPQVEAVGDEADPPDRSERQQSAERTGGRGGHACDHHSHEHGRDGEAAAIQPVGVVGGAGPRPEQDAGGADCGRVQHRPSDACHADPAPFEDERERRSDQERLRARVGAVVDAGGIAARCEQHRHEKR